MLNRIHDLERLLGHHGIEVMPFDPMLPTGTMDPPSVADYTLNENGEREGRKWFKLGNVWAKNNVNKARSRSTLQSRPSDRGYLGVSTDQQPLSSIKGTTLSVLGTSIDITQFDTPDMDMDEPPPDAQVAENLYNKSVQAFLQSVMNINSVPDAHLPIRKDAFQYSEWYFLMVHPFLPVIHKPSYMNLVRLLSFPYPCHVPTVTWSPSSNHRFDTAHSDIRARSQAYGPRRSHGTHGSSYHLFPVRRQELGKEGRA